MPTQSSASGAAPKEIQQVKSPGAHCAGALPICTAVAGQSRCQSALHRGPGQISGKDPSTLGSSKSVVPSSTKADAILPSMHGPVTIWSCSELFGAESFRLPEFMFTEYKVLPPDQQNVFRDFVQRLDKQHKHVISTESLQQLFASERARTAAN